VPVFHALGITSLVVSYRNDGDAPRSRAGAYALGATEWRDVDAAVSWALRHGARRIVLMGWSMGGAIALQTSLGSAHREQIVGVILDSPVVDWRTVLLSGQGVARARARHRSGDGSTAHGMGGARDRRRRSDSARPTRHRGACRRTAPSRAHPAQR
jgi:acetyl esterase/lipase